jgi:hypothetical protein
LHPAVFFKRVRFICTKDSKVDPRAANTGDQSKNWHLNPNMDNPKTFVSSLMHKRLNLRTTDIRIEARICFFTSRASNKRRKPGNDWARRATDHLQHKIPTAWTEVLEMTTRGSMASSLQNADDAALQPASLTGQSEMLRRTARSRSLN